MLPLPSLNSYDGVSNNFIFNLRYKNLTLADAWIKMKSRPLFEPFQRIHRTTAFITENFDKSVSHATCDQRDFSLGIFVYRPNFHKSWVPLSKSRVIPNYVYLLSNSLSDGLENFFTSMNKHKMPAIGYDVISFSFS